MHKISQTDAPAAVPAHERAAAQARFIAASIVAEGKRAAAVGLDEASYTVAALAHLDKAGAIYAEVGQ